jgi:flagellar protein FliL
MAEPEAPAEEGEEKKKKGGGLVITVVIVLVLTLVAAGGGWFLGKTLSGSFITQEKKDELAKKASEAAAVAAAEGGGGREAKPKKPGEDSVPHLATAENGVVMLEPVTTNLAYPSQSWVRLEVALLFEGKPDEKIAEDVHQDIVAYMRTVSLQQVQSARGFEYLRDDIKDRAKLRSEGHVKDVMFRTFVIQ